MNNVQTDANEMENKQNLIEALLAKADMEASDCGCCDPTTGAPSCG